MSWQYGRVDSMAPAFPTRVAALLDPEVGPSRLVMVGSGSSTGKTRAAFAAVARQSRRHKHRVRHREPSAGRAARPSGRTGSCCRRAISDLACSLGIQARHVRTAPQRERARPFRRLERRQRPPRDRPQPRQRSGHIRPRRGRRRPYKDAADRRRHGPSAPAPSPAAAMETTGQAASVPTR